MAGKQKEAKAKKIKVPAAQWGPLENYACCCAALEASEAQQQQTGDMLEARATSVYTKWLKIVAEEETGAWFDVYSKTAGAMWTVDYAGSVREKNGGVYRRFKDTIKPYLINTIGPIYRKFLKEDGTFPSGTQREDALQAMKEMLWEQEQKKRKVTQCCEETTEATADGDDDESKGDDDEGAGEAEAEAASRPEVSPGADGQGAADASEAPASAEEGPQEGDDAPAQEGPAKKKARSTSSQMPPGYDGGPFFLAWLKLGPLGQDKAQLSPSAAPPPNTSRAKQREKQRERDQAAAGGASPAPSRASSSEGGGATSNQQPPQSLEARKIAVLEAMEKRAQWTERREARAQRLKELKAVVDMFDRELEAEEWAAARKEYLALLKAPVPEEE